ncbi:MAG TPA: hypothetical protein VI122_04420 [Thermoleophilaceae bacterium]
MENQSTFNETPVRPDSSAPIALLELMRGGRVAQSTNVAARLGVADQLAEGPRTAAETPRPLARTPGHSTACSGCLRTSASSRSSTEAASHSRR